MNLEEKREANRKTQKQYYERNRAKVIARIKKWKKKNKTRIHAYNLLYTARYPEKTAKRHAKYERENKSVRQEYYHRNKKIIIKRACLNQRRYCKELRDIIIKRWIVRRTKLSTKQVPQGLVELKKAQILFHREIYQPQRSER